MKLTVCAVKDSQIGVFMTPFFVQSTGQAIRSFSDEVNRPAEDNIMYKHPNDFGLYHLGSWESDTGVFELLPREDLLMAGQSCRIDASVSERTRSLKSA